jgi:hypothetical protein
MFITALPSDAPVIDMPVPVQLIESAEGSTIVMVAVAEQF